MTTTDNSPSLGAQLRALALWADRVPRHHQAQAQLAVDRLTLLVADMALGLNRPARGGLGAVGPSGDLPADVPVVPVTAVPVTPLADVGQDRDQGVEREHAEPGEEQHRCDVPNDLHDQDLPATQPRRATR